MSYFRLPTYLYVITFTLHNKKDHFIFYNDIFAYELDLHCWNWKKEKIIYGISKDQVINMLELEHGRVYFKVISL